MAEAERLYKIGEVARRTGNSVECLRAWERRYGLEPAERAGRTRFYDEAQIERLATIKRLLDRGHPISQVINLSDTALDELIRPTPSPSTSTDAALALIGTPLLRAVHDAESSLPIHATWPSVGAFEADWEFLPDATDFIVYLPSLDAALIERYVGKLSGNWVFVYRYATQSELDAVDHYDPRHVEVRSWPTPWETLENLIRLRRGRGPLAAPRTTARRFSDEELVHVLNTNVAANLVQPRDLANLVVELNDFAEHVSRLVDDKNALAVQGRVEMARAELELMLEELSETHDLFVRPN